MEVSVIKNTYERSQSPVPKGHRSSGGNSDARKKQREGVGIPVESSYKANENEGKANKRRASFDTEFNNGGQSRRELLEQEKNNAGDNV